MDQYYPTNPAEKAYFDTLWAAAHQSSDAISTDLSGAEAVGFLRRSNVDQGMLRSIWGFCTPTATMNITQFYTAMRYIALAQAGEMPLNKERFVATLRDNLPPPRFSGINPPSAAPITPVVAPNAGGAATVPNYAITPEEHVKYHALFLSYDTDKDGFLQAAEAGAILSKSGLDNNALAQVWQMSDYDHDNRLSSKEFCLAFHLILCVGKRKLPVPPTLPPALAAFVQNAPSVPNTPPVAPTVVPVPTPVPVAPVVPVVVPPVSAISSLPEPEPSRASSSSHAVTLEDQMELESSVRNISEVAKKAISSQERAAESTDKASSSLKYLLQKLGAEKVSLTSQLSQAEDDVGKAAGRLQSSMAEVSALHAEVEELKAALQATRANVDGAHSRAQAAEQEKLQVLRQIDELRLQLDQGLEGNRALALRVKDLSSEQAALNAAVDGNNAHAGQLQQDISRGSAEIETLRSILSALKTSHGVVVDSSRSLSAQASALQMTSADVRNDASVSAARVATLQKQKEEVEAEKTVLLRQVQEASSAVPVKPLSPKPLPTSVPAPVPVVVAAPTPLAAAADDFEDDKFEDGDTGDDFPPAKTEPAGYAAFGDDFGSDFPATASAAAFGDDADAFPSPAPAVFAAKSADPFGDASAFPAPSTGFGDFPAPAEAFESFESFPASTPAPAAADGFDSFPAPSEAPADGAAPSSGFDDFPSDGFGSFESFPAPTPAADSFSTPQAQHSEQKPAEDTFGDSDFPPPSGDFSFGEFDSAFVEESFSSTHNSPW